MVKSQTPGSEVKASALEALRLNRQKSKYFPSDMSVATLLILKIYYRKYCSRSKSTGTRSLNIPAPNTEDLQALALETYLPPEKESLPVLSPMRPITLTILRPLPEKG